MNTSLCPTCGKPLPDNAPQGLCPSCLMASAMQDTTPAAGPTVQDIQQLAPSFPQLIIEELIGTGGMGRVYRAQQPHLNRTVALKVLTPERASDPEWLERFSREARALARLSHPNIVQVYDFGETPMPFLIMEYVDGVNLRQAMHNGGLTAREALAIVPKLCDALHYAHEHGVLHRDIKPENILIDTEGRVKVVDFGLAKLRDDAQSFTLTQSGARLGTTAYMAPEQIEKPAHVDHRADIYSLGVVFYEMLTGELPLGRFPSPSEAGGTDPRLDGVVLRTLEKNRDKRYAHAAEMKTHVEQLQHMPPRVEPPSPASTSATARRDWVWAGAAAVLWAGFYLGSYVSSFTSLNMRWLIFLALGSGIACVALAWSLCVRLRRGGRFHGVLSVIAILLGVEPLYDFASRAAGGFVLTLIDPWVRNETRTSLIAMCSRLLSTGLALAAVYYAWERWGRTGFRSPSGRWSPGKALTSTLIGCIAVLFIPMLFLPLDPLYPRNRKPVPRPPAAKALPAAKTKPARLTEPPAEKSDASALDSPMNERRTRSSRMRDISNPSVEQVLEGKSSVERNAGFAAILVDLASADPEQAGAGLMSVTRIGHLEFDKPPLRNAVLKHLDNSDASLRGLAILALPRISQDPADAGRLIAMADTVQEPEEVGYLAVALSKYALKDFTGSFGPPMLKLFDRGLKMVKASEGKPGPMFQTRDFLTPFMNAWLSPELEAKVIEWTRLDGRCEGTRPVGSISYDVFYQCLRNQVNKSTASVQRLLELSRAPDFGNVGSHTLESLRDLTDKNDQSLVVTSVADLLLHSPHTKFIKHDAHFFWRDCLRLFNAYATKVHIKDLDGVRAHAGLAADQNAELQTLIEKLSNAP